jgi:uncharacterized protein
LLALKNKAPCGNFTKPWKEKEKMSVVDPKLLEMLVCPVTRETLYYEADQNELISKGARLAYPIREGIPILLPEEARPLDETR